ncbi:MAG: nucleotidyltransferase family protein [Limisphaerales bacterium]
MIGLIQQKRGAIVEACRQFGVGRLEVFGSAARGDFNAQKSDMDFIADFLPPLHPGMAGRFLDWRRRWKQFLRVRLICSQNPCCAIRFCAMK